ncbi:MAG: hypothetical protein JWN12_837 [Candidatus Saccharibacteria bacterium]|nr:hypothetical protein [Candidatus Saccharibacteria bacterium]
MYKSIVSYYNETKHAIEALEDMKDKASRSKAEELYYYHIDRVHDFQHERHIHLLVTFFFSSLLVMAIVGLLWVESIDITSGLLLIYLFAGAGLILFITVLFYVRHYYQLENGVQKLYPLTERLRELLR